MGGRRGPKTKVDMLYWCYDAIVGGRCRGGVLRRRRKLVELRAWPLLWESRPMCSMCSICRIESTNFLREGPPNVSIVCHLSTFAESKKHSIGI